MRKEVEMIEILLMSLIIFWIAFEECEIFTRKDRLTDVGINFHLYFTL